MNLSQKPNTSAQPRMEHAPCTSQLLQRSLLPVETPAWNPASQNYATQGLWGMTAQDYRETQHCPVH